MTIIDLIILTLASFLAGIVNAIAGGGTLITFPALTALGIPALIANVTNTIALSPGYLAGALAQRKELYGQKRMLWILLPVSLAGGVGGGFLLLQTGERSFREIVPWLILFATVLLILQPLIRKWINHLQEGSHHRISIYWVFLFILPAAFYGGYFGAGVSVIIIATLGVMINDTLNRLNALKQVISFVINVATALFFIFTTSFSWTIVIVMATGSILGGIAGGRLAGMIKPQVLRWTIITIGFIVSIIYFIK